MHLRKNTSDRPGDYDLSVLARNKINVEVAWATILKYVSLALMAYIRVYVVY